MVPLKGLTCDVESLLSKKSTTALISGANKGLSNSTAS